MYRVEAIVDMGLYHSKNDDRILLKDCVYEDSVIHEKWNEPNIFIAVADGVGGERAGDVAATETLYEIATGYPEVFHNPEEIIKHIVKNSYIRLQKVAESNVDCAGMATTLTGLVIVEEEIYTFNIGNSRVFRFRYGALRQLTEDDSVVQDMINAGMIEQKTASDMPNRNVITKYIGSNGVMFEPAIVKHNIKLREGDLFLVCSDGILDYVSIEFLETVLGHEIPLAEKAESIVSKIKETAGHDNISLILVEVEEDKNEHI